jgi:hypothetical protein
MFTVLYDISRALSRLFPILPKDNHSYPIRSLLLRAVMHLAARLALLYLFTSEGVQAKPYSYVNYKTNLVLPVLLNSISLLYYPLILFAWGVALLLVKPISPPKGVPLGSPEGRRRP